ncbi:hypothetical protein VPMG_00003 [Vibrio phage VBP32]|uniref:Uncharacterized protein n=2 Tax=Stoningtonvirus VBP47 TaxID=2846606 RepID=M4SQI2_9CAUD|nr:hypothetical protein VPNG_00012 [Vibrio phage VBP47]YP_007676493.1 hypothetical protein VPMG_00003 [Vibrio phage VBP32]AGH57036.1 hypothetical protein VPNG_00012 [Vibrio phage VBP47]AGH57142.1 hypothetical protein VPMG_00003 [Vibrio phage VBP32]WMM35535.1 hypothetical protein [Vibrio phage PJN101]
METVYENATKVIKRVHYQTVHGGALKLVQPGGVIRLPKNSQFKITFTETVE